MSPSASNDHVCTDGVTPDWLVEATTQLSVAPVILNTEDDVHQTKSIDTTTTPAEPVQPVQQVSVPQPVEQVLSLVHFDNTMIAINKRLAEIERLLVANHMNSVPFPDDPVPIRDRFTESRAYRTLVFNAPPRSRSVISRRYRSF
jgi:hypothetical protein